MRFCDTGRIFGKIIKIEFSQKGKKIIKEYFFSSILAFWDHLRLFRAIWGCLRENLRKFTMKCKILGFGHFFIVNMTFFGAQHLAWVGPGTATAKQHPGLQSSPSWIHLRKQLADFTDIVNFSPHLATFSWSIWPFLALSTLPGLVLEQQQPSNTQGSNHHQAESTYESN